eukprot:scaffold141165_cov30-Tisochrysis_lutea.AAC.3
MAQVWSPATPRESSCRSFHEHRDSQQQLTNALTFSCCIKVPSSPSTMSLLDACQYARARASGDSAGRGCPAIVSAPKSQRPRVSRDGALPEVRVARVRRMSCTATLSHEEVVCDETNLWSLERRAARSVGDMERAAMGRQAGGEDGLDVREMGNKAGLGIERQGRENGVSQPYLSQAVRQRARD